MINDIKKSLRIILDPGTNKVLGQGIFINDCFVFPLHIQNVSISQEFEVMLFVEGQSIATHLDTTKIFVIDILKELDLVISRIYNPNISSKQLSITDIGCLDNKLHNNSACTVFSLTFNKQNMVYCVKKEVTFQYEFENNLIPMVLNKYNGWMLKGYSGSPIFSNNSSKLVGFVLGNLSNEPNNFVSINLSNSTFFIDAVKIKIDTPR